MEQRNMMLEIHIIAWDSDKNVVGITPVNGIKILPS
jgi:hypothetical protein